MTLIQSLTCHELVFYQQCNKGRDDCEAQQVRAIWQYYVLRLSLGDGLVHKYPPRTVPFRVNNTRKSSEEKEDKEIILLMCSSLLIGNTWQRHQLCKEECQQHKCCQADAVKYEELDTVIHTYTYVLYPKKMFTSGIGTPLAVLLAAGI